MESTEALLPWRLPTRIAAKALEVPLDILDPGGSSWGRPRSLHRESETDKGVMGEQAPNEVLVSVGSVSLGPINTAIDQLQVAKT